MIIWMILAIFLGQISVAHTKFKTGPIKPYKDFGQKSTFTYDWFVRWFHELLFNKSTNFSNDFFCYVFLEGRIFDCNQNIQKTCRYIKTLF